MKKKLLYILLFLTIAAVTTAGMVYWRFGGENNQPPARTNNPMMYGYYELGNMVLNFGQGEIDTEVWLDHMNYGWAARYRIPLQGNLTLTEALYRMFDDAGWRASRQLPHSRIVFWLPISSFEWIHTGAVPITDTIMVGEPIFVSMY